MEKFENFWQQKWILAVFAFLALFFGEFMSFRP
jgi:hypothetical protein